MSFPPLILLLSLVTMVQPSDWTPGKVVTWSPYSMQSLHLLEFCPPTTADISAVPASYDDCTEDKPCWNR